MMTLSAATEAIFTVFAKPVFLPSVAFLLFCVIVGYLISSGMLTPIEVGTKCSPFGEMTICYKTGRGAYKDSHALHSEIENLVPGRHHVGIFYDDPESVPESELRYVVGSIMAKGEDSPDTAELETVISNGYKIAVLPNQSAAVLASFPLRTALSLYVAIFRVYPKLRNYINAKSLCAYPAIEICTSKVIHFMMPLSKQEEFFVPEFSEEEVSIATTEFSNHPADHSAVDDLRTSSRGSNRKSEESRQRRSASKTTDEDLMSGGDVFVRPTKPAPKSIKKLSVTHPHNAERMADLNEKEDSLSSSYDDLRDENFLDDEEEDLKN